MSTVQSIFFHLPKKFHYFRQKPPWHESLIAFIEEYILCEGVIAAIYRAPAICHHSLQSASKSILSSLGHAKDYIRGGLKSCPLSAMLLIQHGYAQSVRKTVDVILQKALNFCITPIDVGKPIYSTDRVMLNHKCRVGNPEY